MSSIEELNEMSRKLNLSQQMAHLGWQFQEYLRQKKEIHDGFYGTGMEDG